MIRRAAAAVLIVCCAGAASHGAVHAAASDASVTVFVPAFDGPQALGRNVSTILDLQVWQTLRKAPSPNPLNLNFGDGLVSWATDPLSTPTHAGALAAAGDSADMTLWGKVAPYGDGVVVQSHLTLKPSDRLAIWQIATPAGPLALRAPHEQVDFRPFVLLGTVVHTYTSPDAIKLFASPTSTEPIGLVGSTIIAHEQDYAAALVETNGLQGWVKLPALSASRTEVSDFVGGLVALLRGDWAWASNWFDKVVANANTSTVVRVDALLYRGVASERAGRSGAADFQRAHDLNPYDRTACSFLLASQIASTLRAPEGSDARASAANAARSFLNANRYLYPADNPWLARATGALSK